MPFGYIGQNQTKQKIKNNGVLSSFEVSHLKKLKQDSGSLELIQKQTISSGNSMVFTNIKEDIYIVHYFTLHNIVSSSSSTRIDMRFSNDGGSTYEAGTNYQRGAWYGGAIGNGESKNTGTSSISITPDSANQHKGGYCYMHNLGDSTRMSYITFHGAENDYYRFGSGVYTNEETINAFKLFTTNSNNWTGVVTLYGIKQ